MAWANIVPNWATEPLGWTLVHFLWEGTLAAAVLAFALRRIDRREATRRYAVACGTLVATFALPLATFALLVWSGAQATRPEPSLFYDPSMGALPPAALALEAAALLDSPTDIPEPTLTSRWMPTLVLAWQLGVLVFGMRLLGGWCWLQHLRFRGVRPAPESLRRRLEEISVAMGVVHPVWLLESRTVSVPTLIGWLRPVVLMPACALTGLTQEQIEAVIAHELAHVRRHDYLVNLVQSALEALFFYHPAVWWISARIREEREHCCDDVAVEATGDSMALSRALATLAALRRDEAPRLAMAATGGVLFARIQRLVAPDAGPAARRAALPVVFAMLFAVAGAMPAIRAHSEKDPLAALTPEERDPVVLEYARMRNARVSIQMRDARLADVVAEIERQSGMRIVLPPDAAEQRVDADYPDAGAGLVADSMFNLLEMDHAFDRESRAMRPQWWDDAGPFGETRRVSLPLFHARQAMFQQMKHPVAWHGSGTEPLSRALARITDIAGVRFRIEDGLGDFPVGATVPATTARMAVIGLLRQNGLSCRYADDSTIIVYREP